MPLRIELETLWRRLQVRFKARRKTDTDPDDPDHPILLETVQPITNFDELAREPFIDSDNAIVDISGGGANLQFAVPDGKRWKLYGFSKGATSVGCSEYIKDVSTGDSFFLNASATAAVRTILPNALPMDEGDEFYSNGGGGGDVNISFAIYYEEEDAY